MDATDADRDAVLAALAVSRETADRLDRYVALLKRWQGVKNLVAPSTLNDIWRRHILDSAQLAPLLGSATTIVDLGSGAGFPGLVLAIVAPVPGRVVHLVESNNRKAAFLQEAARETGAPAIVHPQRIEAVMAAPPKADLVTARALAPLADLLALSESLLKSGAGALFLKGQDVERELTEAAKSWRITANLIPSITDPAGRVVQIAHAARLGDSQADNGR